MKIEVYVLQCGAHKVLVIINDEDYYTKHNEELCVIGEYRTNHGWLLSSTREGEQLTF